MRVVGVSFRGSNSIYNYFCGNVDVNKDEFVVVDTPANGYSVAKVVYIIDDSINGDGATKHIVCKVDDAAYKEITQKIARREQLERKLRKTVEIALKRAQFEQMLQFMSEEDRKLYEEYKSLEV